MQGRQGAGRVQGQGTEGRAGLQDAILRFSRQTSKITFLQRFCNFLRRKGKGQGAGQAGRRQGAEGRAGLQDSILRFSRPENLICDFLR